MEPDTGTKIKRTISHAEDPSKPTLKTTTKISPVKSLPSVPIPLSSVLGQSVPLYVSDSVSTSEAKEETIKISKPEESYNSLKCLYRKVCQRFLKTLTLPGKSFYVAVKIIIHCY